MIYVIESIIFIAMTYIFNNIRNMMSIPMQ